MSQEVDHGIAYRRELIAAFSNPALIDWLNTQRLLGYEKQDECGDDGEANRLRGESRLLKRMLNLPAGLKSELSELETRV